MNDFDGPHIDACPGAFGASPVLFKGGGAPKPNKKMEAMQMKLMQAQLRQSGQKIEMPDFSTEVPPPAPPPPPPPSSSSSDVQEAATEAQKQALRRTGYQKTLLAGETGGYKSKTLGGGQTLLG
jgi:hypothetical protein